MYRPGELLISGGADPTRADTTSEYGDALGGTSTVIAVDLNGSTPLMTSIDSLSDARVNHNSVVMPNGEVLVTGGESWGRVFSDRFAVTTSEIWNPDTGEWRAADSISSPRTYHSWAVLLEDARVMTGGGGLCGDCGVNHRSAQVFTPAYLLNSDGSDAVRPEIGSVASTLYAGERLVASVQNAPSDLRFSLVRFSSVTHSINTDQRWIPVDSTEIESGLHSVELPVNPNVLIPGRYWLFAYSRDGAPSVGHPVLIEAGSRTSDSVPILPQSASIEVRSDADSDLSISAFEPDGQSLLFSVDNLPPGLQLDRTLCPAQFPGESCGVPRLSTQLVASAAPCGCCAPSRFGVAAHVQQRQRLCRKIAASLHVWQIREGAAVATPADTVVSRSRPTTTSIAADTCSPVNAARWCRWLSVALGGGVAVGLYSSDKTTLTVHHFDAAGTDLQQLPSRQLLLVSVRQKPAFGSFQHSDRQFDVLGVPVSDRAGRNWTVGCALPAGNPVVRRAALRMIRLAAAWLGEPAGDSPPCETAFLERLDQAESAVHAAQTLVDTLAASVEAPVQVSYLSTASGGRMSLRAVSGRPCPAQSSPWLASLKRVAREYRVQPRPCGDWHRSPLAQCCRGVAVGACRVGVCRRDCAIPRDRRGRSHRPGAAYGQRAARGLCRHSGSCAW